MALARKRKLKVAILFGGRSGEHEVSLRSALTVISAMDPGRYEVVPIGIAQDGRWYLYHDAIAMLDKAAPTLGALKGAGAPVSLLPYPDSRSLVPARPKSGDTESSGEPITNSLDVVFPILHGTYGEDGTVQGLLELADVAYVGAGVLGSALGMDKDAQKRLLREAGLPVLRHYAFTRAEFETGPRNARKAARELGYPVFVKPNGLGSSIGVARVDRSAGLEAAMRNAFAYDRKVLIEASCVGRELECAVLGNEFPQASVPGEILVTRGYDFYSYEAKYIDPSGAATRIPARLDRGTSKRVQELSVAAFRALGLRGMARVDFLARPDLSELFVNEVNTIPGFTSISMYPKLWEASGVPLPDLIDRLIHLAIEEHGERKGLRFSYRSKRPHP